MVECIARNRSRVFANVAIHIVLLGEERNIILKAKDDKAMMLIYYHFEYFVGCFTTK